MEYVHPNDLPGRSLAHVSKNTGKKDWFTPAYLIEAARRAMGSIDVDPASHAIAQKWVKADVFYTVEQNGLEQPWFGNIWLNPPYKNRPLKAFVQRLIREYREDKIDKAVVLVNNGTETSWGNALLRSCECVCFHKGRIKFLNLGMEEGLPLQGQMLCGFGIDYITFENIFEQYGVVCRRRM